MAKDKRKRIKEKRFKGSADAPDVKLPGQRSALESKKKRGLELPEFDWLFTMVACVCVMLLAFVTHIITINGGLVLNDRYNLAFLLDNKTMQAVSEQIFSDLVSKPLTQPWLKASLITDRGDYGNNYTWYHAVNVFLHMVTTGYLFLFVLRLGRYLQSQMRLRANPYYLATACAAVFACHPFSCEAVAYLSSRSALLGAANYFLCINLFLFGYLARGIFWKTSAYVFCLVTGAMALWSNPETVSLPFVLLLLSLFIERPIKDWRETLDCHPFVVRILFLCSIAVPFLVLTGIEHPHSIRAYLPQLPTESYVASSLKALPLYYVRCLILPLGLSIDPPLATAASFSDWLSIVGSLLCAGLLYVIYSFRRLSFPCFAGVLILLGFLPHLLMVQTDVVADWVAYLPLAGFSMIVGWGLAQLAEFGLTKTMTVFVSLIVILFGLSVWRDTQWASDLSLWQSALVTRPKSAIAHAMLSRELLRLHLDAEAEKNARLAVEYEPGLSAAMLAQGHVLIAQRKFPEALKSFHRAQELATQQKLPSRFVDEAKLGEVEVLIRQGQFEQAEPLLIQIANRRAADAHILYLVGLECEEKKDYMQALQCYNAALKQDPLLKECWEQTIACAIELKMYKDAYAAAQTMKTNFDSASSRLCLARAAIADGKDSEGEKILSGMIKDDPQNARALYLLSKLSRQKGQAPEAEKHRTAALKIDSDIEQKFKLPEFDRTEAGTLPVTSSPEEQKQ